MKRSQTGQDMSGNMNAHFKYSKEMLGYISLHTAVRAVSHNLLFCIWHIASIWVLTASTNTGSRHCMVGVVKKISPSLRDGVILQPLISESKKARRVTAKAPKIS